VAALALVAGATTAGPARAAGNQPLVLAMRLDTEINPVSASFVKDSIARAESDHAAALVILMDTPGGDSTSMNDIIQAELRSKVAVIVYVAPEGARAASAGAVITMGSDVAAMAPTTHIGAATPIDASGQNLGSDLRRKVLHDAVAQITSLATSHGRNAHAAKLIVTNANEYTAPQALHANLIEHVARSLPVLLGQVDGTTTTYTQKPIVLHTANAHIEYIDMPWTLRLLNVLIDPNLLYLLFLERRQGARRFKAAATPRVPDAALGDWRRVDRNSIHAVNREEVDRILDKISASGIASLTPQERQFLSNFVPPDDRKPA